MSGVDVGAWYQSQFEAYSVMTLRPTEQTLDRGHICDVRFYEPRLGFGPTQCDEQRDRKGILGSVTTYAVVSVAGHILRQGRPNSRPRNFGPPEALQSQFLRRMSRR